MTNDSTLGDQRGARDGQDLANESKDGMFQYGDLQFRFHWWLRGMLRAP